MQCRSHSRRRTIECLFVTACSMDQYAEEKTTEKNLIVRIGISEAETTNNKRLRSTFCIEDIQTRSIARPLCDSRATCSYNVRLSHRRIATFSTHREFFIIVPHKILMLTYLLIRLLLIMAVLRLQTTWFENFYYMA